jgi:hypothetical protein
MREEQAIVEVIPVSKQGEIRHFQVKVPMNATEVIGIQTGVRIKSKATVRAIVPSGAAIPLAPFAAVDSPVRISVVGELKLQSSEKPNVFYGTLVRDAFAEIDFPNPFTVPFFPEKDWTHGNKKEMEKLTIDANTTVISGIYKDNLGAESKRDMIYEVFLAVWFKIDTKKK